MTWVKIDDNLPQNVKLRQVSVAARWTYVSSICYAGNTRSDGFIPASALPMLDGNNKISVELVSVNLWEPAPGGWNVHDFLKHNRSKERITATSEVRREAGFKSAAKRQHFVEQNGQQDASNVFLSGSLSVPLLEKSSECEPEKEKQKANNLLPAPKKTAPTEEWATEMREKYPLRDFEETLRFHMNGSYYRGCADKCAFLEGKLKAAFEREKGTSNGRAMGPGGNAHHRGSPQDDPELQRLRALGVIAE